MKDKVKSIAGYVFLGVLMLYVLGSGIWDLANKNDRYTVVIEDAVPLFQIEHSLNGIIPMGSDYYYLGEEEGTGKVYVLQASKHWLEKSFSAGGAVTVTGLAKKYQKYDVQKEVASRLGSADGLELAIASEKYLSLSYVREACMKIIGIIVLLGIVGVYVYCNKQKVETQLWQRRAFLVLFCVDLIVLLVTII